MRYFAAILLGSLLIHGSPAGAGNRAPAASGEVAITVTGYAGTYVRGALSTVKNSADTVQYISCMASFSNLYSPPTNYLFCVAVDKLGHAASCYSYDASLVNAARSIQANSLLEFYFDTASQRCTAVVVTNSSMY